ncbi:hypothetical protein [Prochlorococcus sp. MIT 1306]|nr:hypothetical protein [Prochlorococcus sp. MIT 1306]
MREVGQLCEGVFLMPGQGANLTARFCNGFSGRRDRPEDALIKGM